MNYSVIIVQLGCTCQGYVITCTDNGVSEKTTGRSINYAKAIILQIGAPSFETEYITPHLLYLDISSSSFTDIKSQLNWLVPETRLLFADVSKNELIPLHFLVISSFSTIHSLDASHNSISYVSGENILKCKNLFVIKLNTNPIITIILQSSLHNIRLVEIYDVPFNAEMSIVIQDDCEIYVTASIICCILTDKIKCTSEQPRQSCYGLLNNLSGYIVYSIAMLLLVILVMLLWRVTKYRNLMQSGKKYYYMAIINVNVADTFVILYYLCLPLVDILNVRFIEWQTSTWCAILNWTLFTVLHCSLAFKVISSLVISRKIIYPFKDQSQYLRYTTLACFIICILMAFPHTVKLIIDSAINRHIFLGKFCSPFDCHAKITAFVFYGIFFDVVCIISFTVAEVCIYKSLQKCKHFKQKNNISTITPVIPVCFKIGKPIYPDIIIRLILPSFTSVNTLRFVNNTVLS